MTETRDDPALDRSAGHKLRRLARSPADCPARAVKPASEGGTEEGPAMISSSATFDLSTRKDWRGAFAALRRLLSNPNDTTQVFRIMRSLNAGVQKAGYERLLRSAEGGRLAY